jgi:hypothetical protein
VQSENPYQTPTEQLDPVKVLEVFVAGRRQILQPD